jgi:hypothetical protein
MAQRVSDDHVERSDWESGGWDEVAVAKGKEEVAEERGSCDRREGGDV